MKQYQIKHTSVESTEVAFSVPYKDVLNPAQYEAVTALKGPLLVIAGAGSGKTRTLTYRVARLVEEGISRDPYCCLLLPGFPECFAGRQPCWIIDVKGSQVVRSIPLPMQS